MRRADIVSGLVLTIFGLITIFVIVPDQISDSSSIGVAPDVFPLTLIWATTIFAILLWTFRLVGARAEGPDENPLPSKDWLFIATMTVFLAASIASIAYLGFIVGGAATIALLMLAMGEREHLLRVVLVSAIAPTALYYVFWHIFYIPLP